MIVCRHVDTQPSLPADRSTDTKQISQIIHPTIAYILAYWEIAAKWVDNYYPPRPRLNYGTAYGGTIIVHIYSVFNFNIIRRKGMNCHIINNYAMVYTGGGGDRFITFFMPNAI